MSPTAFANSGSASPKSPSPITFQRNHFFDPKAPLGKAPEVKKAGAGCKYKFDRLQKRLLRERVRTPFPTKFDSRPLKFNNNKSPRKASIQCPKASTTRFPSVSTTFNKAKTAVPIGQSPGKTSIQNLGTQISPATKPIVIPPSATTITKFPRRNSTEVAQGQQQTTAPLITETDEEDDDIASHLCLVPMKIGKHDGKTNSVVCYWPCLIFSGLLQANKHQSRLYPKDKKIGLDLCSRYLALFEEESDKAGEVHKVVILSLGNADGCCPPEVYNKPIYDGVDMTASSASTGDQKYWKSLDAENVQGGKDVIRLLENHEVVGGYLRDAKAQIPLLGLCGPILENALMELERLCHLDDDYGTTTEEAKHPFVSSLKRSGDTTTTEDEDSPLRPIKFPCHTPNTAKAKRSAATRDALAKAIAFPKNSESPAEVSKAQELATTIGKKRAFKKATPTPTPSKKTRVDTATKAKKPTVKDSKGRISVPSWETVKPLLENLGHTFYDGESGAEKNKKFFCVPNGDPRKNPDAKEGRTFFHQQTEYRAHLCAEGVAYCPRHSKPFLSEENVKDKLELIAYWARFHIFSNQVTGGPETETIPDLELSGNAIYNPNYIRLLQRIGYKYQSKNLNDGYVPPGETKKMCLSEAELWEHLGKYGLSSSCNFEKFESNEERAALEIKIIRKYHGEHGDKIFHETRGSCGAAIESHGHTPAANKDALEECTRGPNSNDVQGRDKVMSPRKLMVEEVEQDETVEKRKVGAISSADVSEESKIDDAGSNEQSKPKEDGKGPTESRLPTVKEVSRLEQPVEDIIEEPVIRGTTISEKAKSCLKELREDKIVARGRLLQSIRRIKSFVDTVIESKGRIGDEKGTSTSPILYICGSPGTGKTMSTLNICKEAVDAVQKSTSNSEKAPRVCHISCPALRCSNYKEGLAKVMQRIGIKPSQLKRSPNEKKNFAIILVLDEVDQLLGTKASESLLKHLSICARDEKNLLSIIGISNSVFNNKTNRLRELGMGGASNKLVFETYRKEDLVSISQSKIGFTVVDKRAHEFIAAKVANSSGDARQYIDLLSKAISFSVGKISKEKLRNALTKPIVMIRDAMLAIRECNPKTKETIQSLTSVEKMTLCAGVHLARRVGGKPIKLSSLQKLVQCAVGIYDDISLEDFKGVIERLSDNGLLQLNGADARKCFSSLGMTGLLHHPIQFDLQLEDVDSALEETIMKEDFYKNMVERVKVMDISM